MISRNISPQRRGGHIRVESVSVSFDGVTVFDEISLEVAPNEVVAILGASGRGKSTLLRVIAGILVADTGRVLFDGLDITDVPTHQRGIGMVFQDNQLFPHLTTRNNVAFGLKLSGVGAAERAAIADRALKDVGLIDFGNRRVTELSGGEAKRVALARTLVTEPRCILLDEPLNGLDRELHDELMHDLADRLRSISATAILVTHDRDEARTIADRTVEL